MNGKFTGTKEAIVIFIMRQTDTEALWDIEPHKEPRSNKANAYFHRLVGLLSNGEKAKFFAKKNELILQYGNHELIRDDKGIPKYELLNDDDAWKSDPEKHYYPSTYCDDFCGVKKRAFVMFKGTHTYNASEMAHLIDCTRNECLGCDIPLQMIETPSEKAMMDELRKKAAEFEKHNSGK